jgi:hypothetical protein
MKTKKHKAHAAEHPDHDLLNITGVESDREFLVVMAARKNLLEAPASLETLLQQQAGKVFPLKAH